MKKEQIFSIILAPHISEKTSLLGDQNNQITFRVAKTATKKQVKQAVEELFEVKVDKVNIVNSKAKQRRFGLIAGKTKAWKKAYVKLVDGEEINFVEDMAV